MRFAERMDHLRASGIRELFDRGSRVPGALDLTIGQVDGDVPEAVNEATIEAIRGHYGGYSPTEGYPDLVEAAHRHLVQRWELPPSDQVMMTSGTTGGIALAVLALAGRGDEVLVSDPHFVLYRNVVGIAGATPVFYDLYPDFRLRAEAIASRVTDRTRLIIVNDPCNPTGGVATEAELAAVAGLCRERGIVVLSDELYSAFSYDAAHVPFKRVMPESSVVVGGFSKSHAMAGWRVGWAGGPPELIDRMRTLQQFLYTCPPTLVQRGLLAAFDVDVTGLVTTHRRRRDLVHRRLSAAGYDVVRPSGSLFAFPRVPWGDDLTFSEAALRRERLLIVPGRTFSQRTTHFRLCYSVRDEVLEQALDALERLVRPD